MKDWLRGKTGGFAAFVIIAALVAGGLGWATAAALRLERERLAQRAEADRAGQLRVALWRMDGLVSPLLAREDSRPFNHYSAVYAPPLAFNNLATPWEPGSVLEPSPLLAADLPGWMLLHFQADAASGWQSPQAPSPALTRRLGGPGLAVPLPNVTPGRRDLLTRLARDLPPPDLLASARRHTAPATLRESALLVANRVMDPSNYANSAPMVQQAAVEFNTRQGQQSKLQNEMRNPQRYGKDVALGNVIRNGEDWLTPLAKNRPGGGGGGALALGPVGSAEVLVHLSPMVPLWLGPRGGDRLLLLRMVRIGEKEVCQGIVLDAPALQALLAGEVKDLFPEARVVPVREEVPSRPELTMTALPFRLDPGPEGPPPAPGWTPLRVGLATAWAAALLALLAVGLGGWSLIDLSQRRIRFVSAVTHELRTPLTTLRLYLDMLLGGMVRDEGQRQEYIGTLHAEADRLHRLVGNVLDFSRLENQRPRLVRARVPVADVLTRLQAAWQGRCRDADKELVIEDGSGAGAALWTDGEVLLQVLGNLIDNACKYSRGAEDRRLWVRARAGGGRLAFEVEDRGPGVPARERRSIFRAFRRGRGADVTAGGVGLGLALARRWTRLLGGRLTLRPAPAGACFRVELPGPLPPDHAPAG